MNYGQHFAYIPRSAPSPMLGIYMTDTANAWYRIITPMRAIGGTYRRIDAIREDDLRAAQTVVLHGIGGYVRDVAATFASLRRYGAEHIIVDYDDAVFHPHPIKDVRIKPFQLRGVRKALQLCDGVTVTTEALRDHFTAYTDKPIFVIPNLVLPEDWPEPPPADHPPVVVLAGSPSHADDWSLVVPLLAQIRQQVPDVQFRLLGYGHSQLKQIATQGGGGWMNGKQYRDALVGGAIGLCPLLDTPFNRGKTPIKAIEYNLAAGMAVIGSPTQYGELLSQDRGFVVDTPQGWAAALGIYLSNPDLRRQHAQALRAHIFATYNAHAYADQIRSAYALEDIVCQFS